MNKKTLPAEPQGVYQRNYVPIRIKDSIEGVRDSNPLMLSNVAFFDHRLIHPASIGTPNTTVCYHYTTVPHLPRGYHSV